MNFFRGPRWENGRQIDGRDASTLEKGAFRVCTPQRSDQINRRMMFSQLVANPAGPFQKIRIVSGEAEEYERIFNQGLSHGIDERSETSRIGSIVLFRDDEGRLRRKRAVKLDDPGRDSRGQFMRRGYRLIVSPVNVGSFEQRIVICREHIGPRELQ